MIKIYLLKSETRLEVYQFIDIYFRKLPRNPAGDFDELADGFADNDVDALRHAYASGVYTMEYGETTAEILGRLNEITNIDSSPTGPSSENMDLWNNAVGRSYGKKANSRKDLFDLLIKALKKGELIIDLEDGRKYKGEKCIKRRPKSLVITIQETKTGENISYYDIGKQMVFSKEEFLALIKAGKYSGYSIKKVAGEEFPFSKRDRFKFNNLG